MKKNAKTKLPRKPIEKLPLDLDPRFAAVAAHFANNPRVTEGKMMSAFGLKVDGKIFAMHVRGDLVVKLPKARCDELVAQGHARYFDPGHGRLMKEWISLAHDKIPWILLAREAYTFVKPK